MSKVFNKENGAAEKKQPLSDPTTTIRGLTSS